MIARRTLLTGLLGATLMSPVLAFSADLTEFKVGYQKSSSLFVVARQQKAFEAALKPLGVTEVRWVEFQFGPPLLEALSAGAIDFGITGDAPPILAQSAGADIVYTASSPAVQNSILVPKESAVKSVADLKGKTIAFGKGSSSHNFVVQALRKAGLTYADITPAFLSPADAVAAFSTGRVDAWAVWDPYFAIAEAKHGARPIVTTADGLGSSSFYLANKSFAEAHPAVVKETVGALTKVADWASAHRDELAQLSADATGIDIAAQKAAIDRYAIEVRPITDEVVAQQQQIADTFYELKLIPRQITVKDAVWTAPTN